MDLSKVEVRMENGSTRGVEISDLNVAAMVDEMSEVEHRLSKMIESLGGELSGSYTFCSLTTKDGGRIVMK